MRPIFPGTIPEYEEREAARFGLYTWRQWGRLPKRDRIRGIAHYRVHRLIEMHEADALNAHAERQSKRAQRRRRIG